jgi:predicted  nucleic acid-binding Zn-ribbon protein
MDVKQFEKLKKKQEELQMAKTRSELKIESLTKELDDCKAQLSALGITSLDNAEELLQEMQKELEEKFNAVVSDIREFERKYKEV